MKKKEELQNWKKIQLMFDYCLLSTSLLLNSPVFISLQVHYLYRKTQSQSGKRNQGFYFPFCYWIGYCRAKRSRFKNKKPSLINYVRFLHDILNMVDSFGIFYFFSVCHARNRNLKKLASTYFSCNRTLSVCSWVSHNLLLT